jgi:hypothetical protein
MPYAVSSTAGSKAPHRKNAALTSQCDSPYQQRTSQSDNPTQVLIKQAVDYLIEQLEAGKSDTLTAYLNAMVRFHSYSFGNILQIARQRPTATRVAGIRTWNQMGRFVKKGEKGIQILAPMMGYPYRKMDNPETEQKPDTKPRSVLIGFRAVYVFERLSRDSRPGFYALDVASTHLRTPAMTASPNQFAAWYKYSPLSPYRPRLCWRRFSCSRFPVSLG